MATPPNTGPITKNGIHPCTPNIVQKVGKSGTSSESSPKASQIAAAGAKTTTGGQHPQAGKPSTPSLAANQHPETMTERSTAEEQKTIAQRFYPKKLGIRGRMPDTP